MEYIMAVWLASVDAIEETTTWRRRATRGRIFLEWSLRRWRSIIICRGKARRFGGKTLLECGKSWRSAGKVRRSALKVCWSAGKVRWCSRKFLLWWRWWWSDQVRSGDEGCRWRICNESRCISGGHEVWRSDESVGGSWGGNAVEWGVVLNTRTHTHTHIDSSFDVIHSIL